MEIVVNDFNALADKIFNFHLRSLTADPFKVLDVPRSATDDVIRKKYFKLARELHPDMVPKDVPEDEKKNIARRF